MTMNCRRRPGAQSAGGGLALCASVVLCLAALAGGARAAGAGWNEFGLEPKAAPAVTDTIIEPFFAFVVGMAEVDSLGTWHSGDVAAFAAARGKPSQFPLGRLVTIERRRPAAGTRDRYPEAMVRAEWVVTFDGPLDFPLPYSILGYHPGSLRVAQSLQLAELAAQDFTLAWREKHQVVRHPVTQVRMFTCESGYMLLDADAVVDHLLGDLLDDAWTVGFVSARDGGGRLSLSLMVGRNLRPIYGEFDLATDAIEPNGRPLAAALAGAVRPWLDPKLGLLPAPWVEK